MDGDRQNALAGNRKAHGASKEEVEAAASPNLRGEIMNGAQAVVAGLEAEGVEYAFGYPGGQVVRIFDALYDSPIRFVLARHEQGAVHEADGFARATGKVGVVLVTSGPGATNTVTGIATAYMDSVPLVVVTGQVPLGVIGTDSFQESDIFGITLPVVKHSYLVRDVRDIPRIIREAFHIAQTGRPGPVLIDVPSDIAAASLDFAYPETVRLPSYKPTVKGNQKQIRKAAGCMARARRPLIIAGGGIVTSGAQDVLLELAESMSIPVVTTLMGKGCLPIGHPLDLGLVGMHGSRRANGAVAECDLLIAVGTRLCDRVTGRPDTFAPRASLVHIDIDPAEIGKIKPADVPIVGDARTVLSGIVAHIRRQGMECEVRAWPEDRLGNKTVPDEGLGSLHRWVMEELSDMLDSDASIVTTEVGQHQMWAAQDIKRGKPRTFITSGGSGTMGFGFPAAIGAKIAHPEYQVVCIAGDGSFQMNQQEMATAVACGAAVKVIIMDNACLGMVHQWQSLFCRGRYAATELECNPDFVRLAEAYGWNAERVEHADQVHDALDRALSAEGPYLLDIAVPREEEVLPMVSPGGVMEDSMGFVPSASAVADLRSDDEATRREGESK
jgi:acetolactate synthase-1/2/3 large subunit